VVIEKLAIMSLQDVLGRDITSVIGQDYSKEPMNPEVSDCPDAKSFAKVYHIIDSQGLIDVFSPQGYLLANDLRWVKPVEDDPYRFIGQRKYGAILEVVTTPSFEPHRVFALSKSERMNALSTQDYDKTDRFEPVFLLSAPAYAEYQRILEQASNSNKPSWSRFTTGIKRTTYLEELSDAEQEACEFCGKDDLQTVIRKHAWKGRVLFGSIVSTHEHIINDYCPRCLDIRPDPEDELEYLSSSKSALDANSPSSRNRIMLEEEAFYRVLTVTEDSSYGAVFTATEDPDNPEKYLVTCELTDGGTGYYLIEREEPSLKADSPKEAAEKCVDIYESYWDDAYRDIEWACVMTEDELDDYRIAGGEKLSEMQACFA